MSFSLKLGRALPGLWKSLVGAAVFLLGSVVLVQADALVHSFNSQGNLQTGLVVALDDKDGSSVVLATAKDLSQIYGVVIDPNSAPLTVQKQAQQVFVATSGEYPVLLSTQNGPIKTGDFLSLSSTDGIAAKAKDTDQFVVGRALQNFSGGSSTIIYTSDGSSLGLINIQVLPGKNPALKDSVAIPQPLKRVGDSIAGKPVSALRIYTALAVFLIAAIMASVLLWGGIKNSMVAIGRNPLSRHPIMKGLTGIMIAAAGVLIIGLIAVYLLLKV